MKHWILKFVAWTLFLLCVIFSLGLFAGIFFVSAYIKDANLNKVVLLDVGLVLFAIFVFILGLGALEFVKEVDEVEEKVEKVEEEMEHFAGKNDVNSRN